MSRAGPKPWQNRDLCPGLAPWGHGPLWCNGSTPAFGAVEYRFESYGRNCRGEQRPAGWHAVPGRDPADTAGQRTEARRARK